MHLAERRRHKLHEQLWTREADGHQMLRFELRKCGAQPCVRRINRRFHAMSSAWMVVWRCRIQEERDGALVKAKGKACTSGGPQMKWFWRLKKALEAQSAMVDVFLAAMLGVTAADHERISEN